MNILLSGYNGNLGKEFLKFTKKKNITLFNVDITNRKKVFKKIKSEKFDTFVHFAAVVAIKEVDHKRKKAMNVNYNGTKNIIDAINKYHSTNRIWFFFSSTSHVYKLNFNNKKIKENDPCNPISFYGKTKLLAENYILEKANKNLRICIGRIFSFSGKNQKKSFLIPALFSKIKKSKKMIFIKNLNNYRDFIHIEDICRAILFLKKKNFSGIVNIGSGYKIKLSEIAEIIKDKLNSKVKIENNNFERTTYVVSSISKLKKLGFKIKKNINHILSDFF